MTINAKPVLKDKFWIIEQDNQRVGTLSWNDDRYIFSSSVETCFFDNTKQMKKKFGTDVVFVNNTNIIEEQLPKENNIHGFPTSVAPIIQCMMLNANYLCLQKALKVKVCIAQGIM